MLLDDKALLNHISDEIKVINELTGKFSFDEIISNRFYVRTIVRCIEVIGEACSKTSDELRSSNPQIPWREISDTRNRIIHDYSGIDYDIIRSIVENDIPELEFQVKKLLGNS